jgi:uncharacterized protein (TIGR02246 family)
MDDAAIRQVTDAFLAAWNSHDMQAFGSLYRDDADFVNVFGKHWEGATEIASAHGYLHETIFKRSCLSAPRVKVKFLGPDVATAHVFWTLTGLFQPNGEPLPDRRGILVNVLVREGSGWKIATTHNTDIVPPPEWAPP